MALKRDSRKRTRELRGELRKNMLGAKGAGSAPMGLPLDYLPITVSNIDFSYDDDFDDSTPDEQAFNSSGELYVEQGQLVAILGPPEGGKSTILKLLGGVVLPKPGGFFVPAHLRVLHVVTQPYFYAGSLFENLVFGIVGDDPDGRMERVMAIGERLGLTQKVLSMVSGGVDGQKLTWSEVLSHTQQALCMLVRATVANPEILCVHKPTLTCDEGATKKVIDVFREFVTNKGVYQDVASRHHRRPRTCIMTSSKILGIDEADAIYLMTREAGIESVSKSQVDIKLAFLKAAA
eukprot:gnl/TRDRNA2_/TRDRNA2_125160_c1_seq1.p1 gnl/TRDRNA2_/TRDRNA2_125160_c1~~gnl/TRDRNA2_/TRDRNA2_125160_c1_seq1.p1  ORF type:complete len:326 (+),score=54.34 gnl/TRDRNA2_/TRDRNA2_125160_c1_seq1:103-978(+)